jgi:hypothetical protein
MQRSYSQIKQRILDDVKNFTELSSDRYSVFDGVAIEHGHEPWLEPWSSNQAPTLEIYQYKYLSRIAWTVLGLEETENVFEEGDWRQTAQALNNFDQNKIFSLSSSKDERQILKQDLTKLLSVKEIVEFIEPTKLEALHNF